MFYLIILMQLCIFGYFMFLSETIEQNEIEAHQVNHLIWPNQTESDWMTHKKKFNDT